MVISYQPQKISQNMPHNHNLEDTKLLSDVITTLHPANVDILV
jgi:hypothetical protein